MYERLLDGKVHSELFVDGVNVPLGNVFPRVAGVFQRMAGVFVAHGKYFVVHVCAVQHPVALAVNYFALLIVYVVVLQHVFAGGKVHTLHLFLCAFQRFAEQRMLNGVVVVGAYERHGALH